MAEILGGFFASIFGSQSLLATIIIAMFPIIELKGAIPIGMSVDYWGEFALNSTEAFIYSMLGSCLVVPIIALVFTPLLNFLKKTKAFRKLATFIEEKVNKHSKDLDSKVEKSDTKKNKTFLKCFRAFNSSIICPASIVLPRPTSSATNSLLLSELINLRSGIN